MDFDQLKVIICDEVDFFFLQLYWFPVAVVMHYHRLAALEQRRLVLEARCLEGRCQQDCTLQGTLRLPASFSWEHIFLLDLVFSVSGKILSLDLWPIEVNFSVLLSCLVKHWPRCFSEITL